MSTFNQQKKTWIINQAPTFTKAGARYNMGMPSNEIWYLQNIKIVFTADATTANRNCNFFFSMGGADTTIIYNFNETTVVTAASSSGVYYVTFGNNIFPPTPANCFLATVDSGGLTKNMVMLPKFACVGGGTGAAYPRFGVGVTNAQVGDTIVASFCNYELELQ